jgi:hypothetical protein
MFHDAAELADTVKSEGWDDGVTAQLGQVAQDLLVIVSEAPQGALSRDPERATAVGQRLSTRLPLVRSRQLGQNCVNRAVKFDSNKDLRQA